MNLGMFQNCALQNRAAKDCAFKSFLSDALFCYMIAKHLASNTHQMVVLENHQAELIHSPFWICTHLLSSSELKGWRKNPWDLPELGIHEITSITPTAPNQINWCLMKVRGLYRTLAAYIQSGADSFFASASGRVHCRSPGKMSDLILHKMYWTHGSLFTQEGNSLLLKSRQPVIFGHVCCNEIGDVHHCRHACFIVCFKCSLFDS